MKTGIVVVGDSGHAKVCIELLLAMGHLVDVCVGVTGAKHCVGLPVLQGDDHLATLRQQGYRHVFIAVGSNRARMRLAALTQNLGYELVNAVSPHAIVSPSAVLGQGIAVMAGAVLNAEARVGDLTIVNTGTTIDHDCHIGQAVHLAPQCALAGNVRIGDRSFLGVGCKVLPEIGIGQDVTLGAGAVVVRDIPDGARAVGVPARIY